MFCKLSAFFFSHTLPRTLISYIYRPTAPSTYSAETKNSPWKLPHFCVVVKAVPNLLSRVGNPLPFAGNKGLSRIIIGRCYRFRVRTNMSADIIKGIPFLDASFHCRTIRVCTSAIQDSSTCVNMMCSDLIMRHPGLLPAPDSLPFLVFVVPPQPNYFLLTHSFQCPSLLVLCLCLPQHHSPPSNGCKPNDSLAHLLVLEAAAMGMSAGPLHNIPPW